MQIIQKVIPPLELPSPLFEVLPLHLVDALRRCGAPCAEEVRLHADRFSFVTAMGRSYRVSVRLSKGELGEILRRLCGGSLYAYQESIRRGYLPFEGGIRVGVCGRAALEEDKVIGISEISGLVVRIPHRIELSATPLLNRLRHKGSYLRGLLLYAPPGAGKTTLLRAVAREASSPEYGLRTVVVDTREELSYGLEGEKLQLNVLVGYPRRLGIEIAVRCLGAQLIVCDEIGDEGDSEAILSAANCGVPLVASTHAMRIEELLLRPCIARLHAARVFESYVGVERNTQNCFLYRFTSWEEAQNTVWKGEF